MSIDEQHTITTAEYDIAFFENHVTLFGGRTATTLFVYVEPEMHLMRDTAGGVV
jgi:hypothetical protein